MQKIKKKLKSGNLKHHTEGHWENVLFCLVVIMLFSKYNSSLTWGNHFNSNTHLFKVKSNWWMLLVFRDPGKWNYTGQIYPFSQHWGPSPFGNFSTSFHGSFHCKEILVTDVLLDLRLSQQPSAALSNTFLNICSSLKWV